MKRFSLVLALALVAGACQDNITHTSPDESLALRVPISSSVPGTSNSFFSTLDVSPTAISTLVTETGAVSASVDGFGSVAPSGTIVIEKPAGATVRRAIMAASSTGGSGAVLTDGELQLDGTPVNWDASVGGQFGVSNHWAEVTSLVSGKLNAAAAGPVEFTVNQNRPTLSEGILLAVVFDDPSRSIDNTVVFMFGSQDVAGDDFTVNLADPVDTSDPDFRLIMGLGISFGFQSTTSSNQVSLIDVNGQRLSSSAGGQDDAQGSVTNGALFTIGGTGDSPTNPPPFGAPTDFDFDDELYDLTPFVENGDTQIDVFTVNPSNDDNIFFAWFDISFRAGVNEPPPPPPPPPGACVGADVVVDLDRLATGATNFVISLSQPTTTAGIFSVQQYLPRTAMPTDLRIGNSLAAGAAATDFRVMDLNNDGIPDLRARWSTSSIGLSLGVQTIQMWGDDRQGNRLFCASTTVNVVP